MLPAPAERAIDLDLHMSEFGADAVRAAIQAAAEQQPHADGVLRGDDREIREILCAAEPAFGKRREVRIVLELGRKAEPALDHGGEIHHRVAEDRAPVRAPGGRIDHPGDPDPEPADRLQPQPGIADALPDAVLDQVGDGLGGLPVEAHREDEAVHRAAGEVGHGHADASERQLHAHRIQDAALEPQHDARAATRGRLAAAHMRGLHQTILDQAAGDGRNRGRAQFGPLDDLDARNRAVPADQVDDPEPGPATGQLRISALHDRPICSPIKETRTLAVLSRRVQPQCWPSKSTSHRLTSLGSCNCKMRPTNKIGERQEWPRS